MKKVLLFPNCSGSGFGHIARCLLLGRELSKRGWTAALVVAGIYSERLKNEGYLVYRPIVSSRSKSRGDTPPVYTFIVDGNIQLIRDGFVRPWRFYAAIIEAKLIVKKFRPDILVGDFSLITSIVGKQLGLPVVQIAQSISHPVGPKIVWWRDVPLGVVSPDIRPVVNPVLSRWKMGKVDRLEDLLQGDMYLIPSIPELEPLSGQSTNTYYTGALISDGVSGRCKRESTKSKLSEPFLYVTLGGGASPFGNAQFYGRMNEVFAGLPLRVTISTGRKFDPSSLSSIPPNVFYHQWVDGPEVIRQSDIVLFHGGQGTMMEVVSNGLPSVILPFHTEQEGNGRRLESLSAGMVLEKTRDEKSGRLLWNRWKYGEFSLYVETFNPLVPDVLRSSILEVLKNDRYREGAERLRVINCQYGGATRAADLVGDLI